MYITDTELFVKKNKEKIIVLALALVGFATSPLISILVLLGIALLFAILQAIEEKENSEKNRFYNFYSQNKNKKKKKQK